MGVARDAWGEAAMFAVGEVAVVLVLVCWFAFHLSSRSKALDESMSAAGRAGPDRDAA
jgi:hypothetical protein